MDHILSNVTIEADIKFENVVRKFFFKMRNSQHQQTIWNPKITRDATMVEDGTFQIEEDTLKL